MKNYLFAFGFMLLAVALINCHRSLAKAEHKHIAISSNEDTVLINKKYKVGDTLSFVYTKELMIFDTMYYSLSPNKTLEFLSEEKKKTPAELMAVRIDISELEKKTEYIYTFVAKKKGTAYFSIINELKSDSPKATLPKNQTTWKFIVE